MFTKWYRIEGITKGMYEANKDDLRKDIVVWLDGDKVEARIMLNLLEAFKMNKEIMKYNKTSEHKMYLEECKERRFFRNRLEIEA